MKPHPVERRSRVSKDGGLKTSLTKIHHLLTNPADNAHQEIAGKSSLLGAGRE